MGRPYKGLRMQATVRMTADQYQKMAQMALTDGITVSEWIDEAVRLRVERVERDERRSRKRQEVS